MISKVPAAILFLLALVSVAPACSVCFGAPESNMTEGMNLAIIAMLGVIGALLLSFGAFFVYLNRKGKLAQGSEG